MACHGKESDKLSVFSRGSAVGVVVMILLFTACTPGGQATEPPSEERASPTTPTTLLPSQVPITYLAPVDSVDPPAAAFARFGRGTINDYALSPDGSYIAIGGSIGIFLYEAQTFNQSWFSPTNNEVTAIAWSPDETRLVSGGEGGEVILWNAQTGELIRTLGKHTDSVLSIAWSPNGKLIASGEGGGDSYVIVWDYASGLPLHNLEGQSPEGYRPRIETVIWSPDSSRLAWTGFDGIHIWEFSSDRIVRTFDSGGGPQRISWSPDGSKVAVISNGQIEIRSPVTGDLLQTLAAEAVGRVAWSPDGKLLASAVHSFSELESRITIWDLASGRPSQILMDETMGKGEISWSPDSSRIYLGETDYVSPYELATSNFLIWNVTTGELEEIIEFGTRPIWSLAWSPDSRYVVAGGDEGILRVWEPATGDLRFSTSGHRAPIRTLAWSPDGDEIASGGMDYAVFVWDVQSGSRKMILDWHVLPVDSVVWSSDSQFLATASGDGYVIVWDPASGERRMVLEPQVIIAAVLDPTNVAINWSEDNSEIWTVWYDGRVLVWDAENGQQLHEMRLESYDTSGRCTILFRPNSLSWSPDDSRIVIPVLSCMGDGLLVTWDVDSGAILEKIFAPGVYGATTAWSPDGQWLALGATDGVLMILDPDGAFSVTHTYLGHNGAISKIAWSPDGNRLATGSWDGTVIIWDTSDLR